MQTYLQKRSIKFIRVKYSDFTFFKIHTVCFDSLWPHAQSCSYLSALAITCDKGTNLDLCCFSSEGSFMCHTFGNTGPPYKRPVILDCKCSALAKEQSLPGVRFDTASTCGAWTYDLSITRQKLYHWATTTASNTRSKFHFVRNRSFAKRSSLNTIFSDMQSIFELCQRKQAHALFTYWRFPSTVSHV
jgi:hypothetical protein